MPLSKSEKLYERVQMLVNILSENHKSFQIHNNINEFYYLEKVEELKQLEESIADAYKSMYEEYARLEMLKDKYNSEFIQLYSNWRKDIRWVNRFVNQKRKELETKS